MTLYKSNGFLNMIPKAEAAERNIREILKLNFHTGEMAKQLRGQACCFPRETEFDFSLQPTATCANSVSRGLDTFLCRHLYICTYIHRNKIKTNLKK